MLGSDIPIYYFLNGIRFNAVLFSDRIDCIKEAYSKQQLTDNEAKVLLSREDRRNIDELMDELFFSE